MINILQVLQHAPSTSAHFQVLQYAPSTSAQFQVLQYTQSTSESSKYFSTLSLKLKPKHIALILSLILSVSLSAQTYTVEKTPFSSGRYDEFSPVFYEDGIVFCSNRSSNSMVKYSNAANGVSFSMYYIRLDDIDNWKKAELVSKHLSTKFNDGPSTFNSDGNIIYYSRNLFKDEKTNDKVNTRNKLGLFTAVLKNGEWNSISEYRLNNDWYNTTTPCLSPDGQRLYYSSDMPGGYGGADLYYCQWNNGYWEDPVNLGPDINTSGNESYPFVNIIGELFFSSDGHPGLGGKDIFVTKQLGTGWYTPHRLDAPINSIYDDFGIVTDSLMTEGYFSTNRDRTIDIYSFRSLKYKVWFVMPQEENSYCLTLKDTGAIDIDTLKIQHEWDFGENIKIYGDEANYCFPGPAEYKVKHNMIDKQSGDLFFHKSTYEINITDIEQPFINSPDFIIAGEIIDFDGLKSYCPGFDIIDFFWEFGDDTFGYGSLVSHTFISQGEFNIKLGLTLRSKETGKLSKRAVSKKIIVFNGEQERDKYISNSTEYYSDSTAYRGNNNFTITGSYLAERDIKKEAIYRLELFRSNNRVDLNSPEFKNVPGEYEVNEIFCKEDSTYSYVVGEQMDLMLLYTAYKKIKSSGILDSRIVLCIITDPAEKELYRIKKIYGTSSDLYFDSNNKLVTNGYLMLDQLVILMNKYPERRLKISIHTDNIGPARTNLALSNEFARIFREYLLNRGIEDSRLEIRGLGERMPISSNLFEPGRKLNRRIGFSLIE